MSIKRFIRRSKTRGRRLWKKSRRTRGFVGVAIAAIGMISVITWRTTMIDANYTMLLDTIARGESHGNYNAYFGHADNSSLDFTAMSVGEVLEWQRAFVAGGQPSNAVGKYQFIYPTLDGLVQELHIDPSTRFDASLQDRLAIRLLERRGVKQYLSGHLTSEQFAHNLSMEWAALPRVIGGDPAASYYAGDGLNHARIAVADVLAAIESLHSARG